MKLLEKLKRLPGGLNPGIALATGLFLIISLGSGTRRNSTYSHDFNVISLASTPLSESGDVLLLAAIPANPSPPLKVTEDSSRLALRRTSDLDYRGLPSISAVTIEQVLAAYHSPAQGSAAVFYDLGLKFNIDPAFLLAFYIHESSAGTQGIALTTRSIGNIRCTPGWHCAGGFRAYASFAEAATDWYNLLTIEYFSRGLTTSATILPVYAPASENDVSLYVNTVDNLVKKWRAAEPQG